MASIPSSASAIPAFARRENMACASCHTTIPRLNRLGYQYRNAGFRLPGDIGVDRKVAIADMLSARTQTEANITHVNNEASKTSTTSRQIQAVEFTLYPVTGSFGKWWSSFAELSFSSEDFWEIENAYLRGTFGKEENHFQARFGVFHPWEGYGASDRTAVLARPLFQTTAAKNSGVSTFFTPWGFDQAGLEAGYTAQGFNVAGTLFNGIYVNEEEQKAFPFQGGELQRPADDPNRNSKDIQLFANQFITVGKTDAAVSAFYYSGKLTVPFNLTTGASYTDSFQRLALYGTLPIALSNDRSVWALAGFQRGWDTGVNPTTGAMLADKFTSTGWFGEAYLSASAYFGASARYDHFKPSDDGVNNAIKSFTLGANVAALNGVQGILEYQLKNATTGATTSTKTNQVRARVILIL
jgi:hypothetical protein